MWTLFSWSGRWIRLRCRCSPAKTPWSPLLWTARTSRGVRGVPTAACRAGSRLVMSRSCQVDRWSADLEDEGDPFSWEGADGVGERDVAGDLDLLPTDWERFAELAQAGHDFSPVAHDLHDTLDRTHKDLPSDARSTDDVGLTAPPPFPHAEGPARAEIWMQPGSDGVKPVPDTIQDRRPKRDGARRRLAWPGSRRADDTAPLARSIARRKRPPLPPRLRSWRRWRSRGGCLRSSRPSSICGGK